MVKMDIEDYGICNTTIGEMITAIETEIASYITEIDTLLSDNQMGDTRAAQMGDLQSYMKTTMQGVLQTIETAKHTLLDNSITAEEEMDVFQ